MQRLRAANRSAGSLGCLFEVVETLVLTILIFLGIQTFVAQPYKVQQGSMETTLMPDQYVLVDKLTPHFSPYKRGDIVVFDPPENWSTGGTNVPFIKRIIGLPGDTVELRNGLVYVNGAQLDEPYIYEDNGIPQTTDPQSGQASEWIIPEDQLLVFGDHRENSADSRTFGPIEIKHVIGRAWLRYWPFDTFGVLQDPDYGSSPSGNSTPTLAPNPTS